MAEASTILLVDDEDSVQKLLTYPLEREGFRVVAARDDELDKVLGLELGADDYITKPFSIREFRSRVRALLRRAAVPKSGGPEEEVIEEGDVRIDLPRRGGEGRGQEGQLT